MSQDVQTSRKRKRSDYKGINKENECEQYLIEHNIPYSRGVILHDNDIKKPSKFVTDERGVITIKPEKIVKGKQICEFDFIIPGAIIEVKSTHINTTSINAGRWKQQMRTIKRLAPPNFTVYLYIEDATNEQKTIYNQKYGVTVITRFNEIVANPIPYFIQDSCVLRSIVGEECYKGSCIYTVQSSYAKASIIFEKEQFDSLNIKVIDDVSKLSTYCLVGKNNYYKHNARPSDYAAPNYKIFKIFYKIEKIKRLKACIPKIKLEGVSDECSNCHQLFFVRRLDSNKVCVICRAKRQKIDS